MSKERMARKRLKDKEAGMSNISIVLTRQQRIDLDKCLSHCDDITRNDFLAMALVTGAKFRVNSGGTLKHKIK